MSVAQHDSDSNIMKILHHHRKYWNESKIIICVCLKIFFLTEKLTHKENMSILLMKFFFFNIFSSKISSPNRSVQFFEKVSMHSNVHFIFLITNLFIIEKLFMFTYTTTVGGRGLFIFKRRFLNYGGLFKWETQCWCNFVF